MCTEVSWSITSPVSGCNVEMRSISSPKNSMRIASSSYTGMISTVSPRTRNVPRVNRDVVALVLHVDELAKQLIAVNLLAFRRNSMRPAYSSGVPRP